MLWMAALFMFGLGLLNGFSPEGFLNESLSMFMLSAVNLFSSFLVLPSVVFSLYSILGKQPKTLNIPAWLRKPFVWFIFFLVAIWLGNLISKTEFAWFLLPGFHILGIGLPVLLVLSLAVRRLSLGSLQRRWGVFASGLVLGPSLIMVAEAMALIILLATLSVWLAGQPAFIEQLHIFSDLAAEPSINPDELINTLAPILLTPWALLLALLFVAVLVPIIEELFKPIGVWLLFGRKLSPEAGFAAGAISGASYALFESLVLTLGGESWSAVVLARIGTGTVHILTSAVTGWALVQAWQKRGVLRLFAAYAFGVTLHGLWNGVAVVTAFASMSNLVAEPPEWLSYLESASYGMYFIGFLAAAALAGLVWCNWRLWRSRQERLTITSS